MPFDNTSLIPLLTGSGFTLWLYRTSDTRATALGANYFSPAASRITTGDLILLQSSDSVGLLPVRSSSVVAAGVVLDTAAAPFRVNRTAAQRFSVRQAATAVAMTAVLAPLAAGIVANGTVNAQATIVGPVPEVAFSISDATGATVRGPQTAAVSAGTATATLPAPPAGSGYRMRVQATIDPAVADSSAPFAVTAPYGLLLQTGVSLLLEDGGRVLI
ncbi:hypothetical protein [Falsiroseomonas sp.]|jgi:hypothetical protein|uniref:hypothetical protein n=1 Tax=Falsiroseomonas sp. TaxID=2870721 RepID=UPI003F716B7A